MDFAFGSKLARMPFVLADIYLSITNKFILGLINAPPSSLSNSYSRVDSVH